MVTRLWSNYFQCTCMQNLYSLMCLHIKMGMLASSLYMSHARLSGAVIVMASASCFTDPDQQWVKPYTSYVYTSTLNAKTCRIPLEATSKNVLSLDSMSFSYVANWAMQTPRETYLPATASTGWLPSGSSSEWVKPFTQWLRAACAKAEMLACSRGRHRAPLVKTI